MEKLYYQLTTVGIKSSITSSRKTRDLHFENGKKTLKIPEVVGDPTENDPDNIDNNVFYSRGRLDRPLQGDREVED